MTTTAALLAAIKAHGAGTVWGGHTWENVEQKDSNGRRKGCGFKFKLKWTRWFCVMPGPELDKKGDLYKHELGHTEVGEAVATAINEGQGLCGTMEEYKRALEDAKRLLEAAEKKASSNEDSEYEKEHKHETPPKDGEQTKGYAEKGVSSAKADAEKKKQEGDKAGGKSEGK